MPKNSTRSKSRAHGKKRTKSYKAMIAQLEALIADESITEEERANARDKLDKIRKRQEETQAERDGYREQAREYMRSEDAGRRYTEFVRDVAGLARFSFGNVLMIMAQAEQRGVKVTELYTKAEWLRRGRKIRKGAKAYVVCEPMTRSRKGTGPAAPGAVVKYGTSQTGSERFLSGFRYSARWFDIADTEPHDFKGPRSTDEDDAQAGLPQAFTDVLLMKIRDAGWTVEFGPTGTEPVTADHDSMTVTIAERLQTAVDDETLIQALAALLAEITGAAWDRAEARAKAGEDDKTEKPAEKNTEPDEFDMSGLWG
ncbi:ArdC-like ssDNA-binding domain-containing protein [Salininema proteolyticum]|uniref:ArdC-like ssDNA-binding domain-containing protein n=1 Tax=Salininema proteolyticum TaxID=1607685 RepID=A0ABV8U045_9ACTN